LRVDKLDRHDVAIRHGVKRAEVRAGV